jgi:hypothetical protein
VFYVGYIIFELPSNIALKMLGAANWLSFLALSFGLITVGMGLVKNYASLVVLRILLGALEAVRFYFELFQAYIPLLDIRFKYVVFALRLDQPTHGQTPFQKRLRVPMDWGIHADFCAHF